MKRQIKDPIAQRHYDKMKIGIIVVAAGTITLAIAIVLFLLDSAVWLVSFPGLAIFVAGMILLCRPVGMRDVTQLRTRADALDRLGRAKRADQLSARANQLEYALAVRQREPQDM